MSDSISWIQIWGTGRSFNKIRPSSSKKCWHTSRMSLSTELCTGRSPEPYFIMVWLRLRISSWYPTAVIKSQSSMSETLSGLFCRAPLPPCTRSILYPCCWLAALLQYSKPLLWYWLVSCSSILLTLLVDKANLQKMHYLSNVCGPVSLSFFQDWLFSYKFYHHLNSHEFLDYLYCSEN